MKSCLMYLMAGTFFVVSVGYAAPSDDCAALKNGGELACNAKKTDMGCSWSAGECIWQCVNYIKENCTGEKTSNKCQWVTTPSETCEKK